MTETRADTAGAIAGLTSVLGSMEHRIARIDDRIADTRRERTNRLDHQVASLLPGISRKAFDHLRREVPHFIDRKITDAFTQNGKLLGIFRTAKYDATLALMRTQLKKYLENKNFVAADDNLIMQLEAERAKLAAQQTEAIGVLKLVERAHRGAAPLPQEAVAGINTIAKRGRSFAQPAEHDRRAPARSDHTSESNSDLWLWMMTDIPSSFRTLMLDTLSVHDKPALTPGSGLFGGAGAQGSWETPDDQAPTNAQPAQSEVASQAAGFSAGVIAGNVISERLQADTRTNSKEAMIEAMPTDPDVISVRQIGDPASASALEPLEWPAQNDPMIATDDRLGAFS